MLLPLYVQNNTIHIVLPQVFGWVADFILVLFVFLGVLSH